MSALTVLVGADQESCRWQFEAILRFVDSDDAFSMEHSQLEETLAREGRELIRRLLQEHLDRRAEREPRVEVTDAEGVERTRVEQSHSRSLSTVVGEVEVTPQAYRAAAKANLHPADAELNLPLEKYSHGLRKEAALEAAAGAYEGVQETIRRHTGVEIGKRQVEELTIRSARDFEDFYAERSRGPHGAEDVLVISADGKGIRMLQESLREGTQRAAADSQQKLGSRLSRGEKGNRKRIAEVGAVYDLAPVARTPEQILGQAADGEPRGVPKARGKWVTASVVENAAAVVGRIFDEAERRDPEHHRTWVVLVDGNNQQLKLIRQEAQRRGAKVHILCDLVHVLEYLWQAAWCFFEEGDIAAEAWVKEKALAVLRGRSGVVAAAIRRTATRRGLSEAARKRADRSADYLHRKAPYLDYPRALREGWPIASGVIEGAVRHLVKDRMDITGARWGLEGAEAVLRLRALRTNGDFEAYWRFHLTREKRRNHLSRYRGNSIPGDNVVP